MSVLPNQFLRTVILTSALAAAACASTQPRPTAREVREANDVGRAIAPVNATEEQILADAERLPADMPKEINGTSVTASLPYFAASGRTCRRFVIGYSEDPVTKLSCKGRDGWYFVPNIFARRRPRTGNAPNAAENPGSVRTSKP